MTVYEKVVSVAKPYLGPATEAFIGRQCKAHLKKEAADLVGADLATLSKWMEIGASMLMDDPAKATQLATKVKTI